MIPLWPNLSFINKIVNKCVTEKSHWVPINGIEGQWIILQLVYVTKSCHFILVFNLTRDPELVCVPPHSGRGSTSQETENLRRQTTAHWRYSYFKWPADAAADALVTIWSVVLVVRSAGVLTCGGRPVQSSPGGASCAITRGRAANRTRPTVGRTAVSFRRLEHKRHKKKGTRNEANGGEGRGSVRGECGRKKMNGKRKMEESKGSEKECAFRTNCMWTGKYGRLIWKKLLGILSTFLIPAFTLLPILNQPLEVVHPT